MSAPIASGSRASSSRYRQECVLRDFADRVAVVRGVDVRPNEEVAAAAFALSRLGGWLADSDNAAKLAEMCFTVGGGRSRDSLRARLEGEFRSGSLVAVRPGTRREPTRSTDSEEPVQTGEESSDPDIVKQNTVAALLMRSGVPHDRHAKFQEPGVFLTTAGQIVGSYEDLRRVQRSRSEYVGWDAHHIVEYQDLDRLGVASQFPPYERQLCVLIPKAAHAGRINSLLRNQAPIGVQVTADDLRRTYRDAYSLMGDYCGGGELAVREELMKIVDTVLRGAAGRSSD